MTCGVDVEKGLSGLQSCSLDPINYDASPKVDNADRYRILSTYIYSCIFCMEYTAIYIFYVTAILVAQTRSSYVTCQVESFPNPLDLFHVGKRRPKR